MLEPEDRPPVFSLVHLLPGAVPAFTLISIAVSTVVTVLGHRFGEATYRAFYGTGWELWADAKVWTLLTSPFLHAGALHLIANLYCLWIFGRVVERDLGFHRTCGLFAVSGWLGGVAELAISGEQGVGASGVVYAWFGFLLVQPHRDAVVRRLTSLPIIVVMLGSLVLGFFIDDLVPIANYAHVGGLVIGCVYGVGVSRPRWRRPAAISSMLLSLLGLLPLLWAPWHADWWLARSYRAMRINDDDAALRMLAKVREKRPEDQIMLELEAGIRIRKREYDAARGCLDTLVRGTSDPRVLNTLAWLLATCPQDAIRNGSRAVVLAQRACEGDGWKEAAYIDTLAAAYAEVGDFAQAEKFMLQALENPGEHAAVLQEHLVAFRAGKPWREP